MSLYDPSFITEMSKKVPSTISNVSCKKMYREIIVVLTPNTLLFHCICKGFLLKLDNMVHVVIINNKFSHTQTTLETI